MANKKISQLAGTVPNEIVSGSYLFASAAGNVGVGYETKKITAQQIAEYVFTGAEGTSVFQPPNFREQKTFTLTIVIGLIVPPRSPPNYGFLMLRTSDGLLTTGSGIGTPVDGDNLGDHTATQPLNMQGNDITSADDIRFENGGAYTRIYNGAKSASHPENLMMQAGNELTLKGNKHVLISGDALSLASIPISGAIDASLGITFTGGNIEVDPAHKLNSE